MPVGGDNCLMMVPIDDNSFFRMSFATKLATRLPGSEVYSAAATGVRQGQAPFVPGPSPFPERQSLPERLLHRPRDAERNVSYTGIRGITPAGHGVTESMGTIYDRTSEHLGTTDGAVIRMRRMLIKAAKDLANGIEPPVVDPSLPYDKIPLRREDPRTGRRLAHARHRGGPGAARSTRAALVSARH